MANSTNLVGPERVIFEGVFSEATASEDGAVIRDVLLCGNQSANGYAIPESAFGSEQRAIQLYSNSPVYLDHDMENGPARKAPELAAIVTNVRFKDGKPRGDFLLNTNAAGVELKHLYDFTVRAEKAGAKVKHLGCSHVAQYTFADKTRKAVKSVDQVYSVDVVVNPATTRSFKEQTSVGDELKGLTDELNQLRGERDQLKSDLKAKSEAFDALQTKHNELQTEAQKSAQELDTLKAEKAISVRKADIEAALKAANLDTADKDVCSEAFLDTLTAEANAEKRATLIKDRAGLLAKAKAAGPTSSERKEENKTFDPSKALENISFS